MHQRHTGIALQAVVAQVHVTRIVTGSHGASATSQHIQVIHIIAMRRHNRMVAIFNQYQIAVDESQGIVAGSRGVVQPLERISLGFVDPVVINFVEVHFKRGVVHIMLVRRIARPISARRIDLAEQEFIGRKFRANNVDDLPSAITPATNFFAAIRWRDNPGCKRREEGVRQSANSQLLIAEISNSVRLGR